MRFHQLRHCDADGSLKENGGDKGKVGEEEEEEKKEGAEKNI